MKVDILVAEIGSTTTLVNGFSNIHSTPAFIGQGIAPTSVLQGDVTIGIQCAIDHLKEKLNIKTLSYESFYATSSAAGGLKMTVHGLVYDMTVRAAKEAALGAGANINYLTAGKLRSYDLKKIRAINPNIILIAGGVDFGERETALFNANCILELDLSIPVIYAGNKENQEEIKMMFKEAGKQVVCVENVYPKIDMLNSSPVRKAIQQVFEAHISKAPGMEKVKQMVNGHMMPTPGAVMVAAQLLEQEFGDLIVIDIGGATTDVHSVTNGSDKINDILVHPEPKAKRTVEGDLGVYINRDTVIDKIGKDVLAEKLKIIPQTLETILKAYQPVINTREGKQLCEAMAYYAVIEALERHAGSLRTLYGPTGKRWIAEGKDLTNVKTIIGTGGVLTRLEGHTLLKQVMKHHSKDKMLPRHDLMIRIDRYYSMASLGVLSKDYPNAALQLLKESLSIE